MKFREIKTGYSFDNWHAVLKHFCKHDCANCVLSGDCILLADSNPWYSCGEIANKENFIRRACELIGFEVSCDALPPSYDNHILTGKITFSADDQAVKADAGKPRLTLVPRGIIWAIAAIREYGCKKYKDPDNWKRVEKERYRDAAYRHFMAYLDDPKGRDAESGLLHLHHLATNIAFLIELEEQENE